MRQSVAERYRSPLVENNPHPPPLSARSFGQASPGAFQHGLYLPALDARKPFEEFLDRRPRFEILEKRPNGNARTAKDPGTTHLIGRTLHFRALRPIQHRSLYHLNRRGVHPSRISRGMVHTCQAAAGTLSRFVGAGLVPAPLEAPTRGAPKRA